MAVVESPVPLAAAPGPWWRPGFGWPAAALLAGLAVLFVPSFVDLARTVWPKDEQGHGPLILAVSLLLAWQRRAALAACEGSAPRAGAACFAFGLLCYLFGRTQKIDAIEVGALLPVLAGLLLWAKGRAGLRVMAFPLFFLIFMVPLPGLFVQMVTMPLKAAVSWVAGHLLQGLGYPLARSGVILQVGQYQLLVADACAGLNSMFTLEALCLLYLSVIGHTSARRRALLAVMAVPVAFVANVVRVMILVAITYHFGDKAGQGFVHEFASLLLFAVALLLILAIDGLYGWVARRHARRRAAPTVSGRAAPPASGSAPAPQGASA